MSKVTVDKNKNKNLSREELLQLSKEELADRIIQLEAHTQQLKNIISKKNENLSTLNGRPIKISDKKNRDFDFSKFATRRILLRVGYLGQNYNGLATQEDTNNTIEYFLFSALKTTRLIQSRETANYHRCGRTDKGVSASGQVISITVRSSLTNEEIVSGTDLDKELPYCRMLNRLLPDDIRAICWMPIPDREGEPFSARFDCKYRIYKYWFPKCFMDIDAMNEGCKYLEGSHDFRNLCKMDVGNGVTTFIRNILKADVICHNDNTDNPEGNAICYLKIIGNAFLWHQIRCIAALLFLIGNKKESPTIIKELLDVNSFPQKPQYNMAIESPLNLFHCSYEDYSNNLSNDQNQVEFGNNWYIDTEEIVNVIKSFREQWIKSAIRASMINDIITNDLMNIYNKSITDVDCDILKSKVYNSDSLFQGVKAKSYVPLLKRPKCETLENRIKHYVDKKRLKQIDPAEQ